MGSLLVYLLPSVFYLLLFGVLALIPSSIASKKGYSAVGFYFFGLFLFVPALIVAICIVDKDIQFEKDNLDLLLRYNQAYSKGLISKEAFEKRKKELLEDLDLDK